MTREIMTRDGQHVSVRDCGYSAAYVGKKRPRCAGGAGCHQCWTIYLKAQGHKPSKAALKLSK